MIDDAIEVAETLPKRFYTDSASYELVRENVLLRGWHLVGRGSDIGPQEMRPTTLLAGCLDEPIVLVRDAEGVLHALSNVCTHRGATLLEAACKGASLKCPYHGRQFTLDGRFRSMPEMDGVESFPSPRDDLLALAVAEWGPLVFVSFDPHVPFADLIADVEARAGDLDPTSWSYDPDREAVYDVRANWALYVDNYLEGFHIPFVHPELAKTLDYRQYESEAGTFSSLQIGVARDGEVSIPRPAGHPDAGRRVGAYYFYVYPTTMLNFYPWGLSANIVLPTAIDRTTVRFESYVRDPGLLDVGAGASLDIVQREDEAIVASVQRGVRSRAYERGRYSARRERCVHHFHKLLAAQIGSFLDD